MRAVARGVTRGSSDQYERQWRKWTSFVRSLQEDIRPDNLLQSVEGKDEKVLYLMAFIDHVTMDLGVKGYKEVSEVVSGIRYKWAMAGIDSEFFEDQRVKAAKKGARLTTEEMREAVEKSSQNRKLPACREMMVWLRGEYWIDEDYSGEELYRKATYLAAAVAYDTGSRPGNVRKVDGKGKEDHCIRAGDIVFTAEYEGNSIRLRGGEQIRSFLGVDDDGRRRINSERLAGVKSVGIRLVTSKTSNKVRAPIKSWEIGRGSPPEEMLMSDLCRFMVMSGVKEGDPFCSRYAVDKKGEVNCKTVTSKDLGVAVKKAARALNLPADKFSSKSLRSGFASQMSECQVPEEQFIPRGGWSSKSSVPKKHYIHKVVRGAYSTLTGEEGDEGGWTAELVQAMLPVTNGPDWGGYGSLPGPGK